MPGISIDQFYINTISEYIIYNQSIVQIQAINNKDASFHNKKWTVGGSNKKNWLS